jgi:predicted metalloprotease
MKWQDFRTSDNVEDRRGEEGSSTGGWARTGGTLGIGGVIVLFIISQLTGIDFRTLLGGLESLPQQTQTAGPAPPAQPPASDRWTPFIGKVLAATEDTWAKTLPAQQKIAYSDPKLVRYAGETNSGCGAAQSAMGPFYCPNDRTVYIDTSFFDDMKTRYGGGGDFAYAYVIAHEVGHHVQNLLGILPKMERKEQAAANRTEANALSVRIELMADCLAGVWAYNANQNWQILEPGDIERALATASAIGDDRLQRAGGGAVVPDSFTHGTAVQRQRWLTTGLKSGRIDSCTPLVQ